MRTPGALRTLILFGALSGLGASALAQEAAGGDEPVAVAPAATELVSVTVERTVDLAEDPGAASSTRRGNQLVLRIRLSAEARQQVQDRASVSVRGHFDDEGKTPIALNADARERLLLESRKDESSVLHLTFELPPEGATGIEGFGLFAGKEAPASDGSSAAQQRYFVVKDVRASKGENLGPPGSKHEWYRFETFGPKSISMRQLTDDAPAIQDLRLTNVEGTLLEPIPHASNAIRDPAEGGWVAILVFEEHVPLVVNLLIPEVTPPPAELLGVGHIQLP